MAAWFSILILGLKVCFARLIEFFKLTWVRYNSPDILIKMATFSFSHELTF